MSLDGTTPDSVSPTPPQGRIWRKGRRRFVLGGLALLALLAAGLAWRHFSVRETTDDAQVEGHVNAVSARVGGTVLEVLVEDNQFVEKDTPLVRIDPRDYRVAVAKAEADLAESEASARAARTSVPVTSTTTAAMLSAAESELEGARARLAAQEAGLVEARARERKAAQDLERVAPLVAKDEVSKQEHDALQTLADATRAAREAAAAGVRQAQKAIEAAEARLAQARTGKEQVQIAGAHADSAEAKAAQDRAVLEQARLNLSDTEVRAPVSGIVSRRTVEVGQLVQAGQPLLAVVPLDDLWVVANFKENQLHDMKPGQPVSISVDALDGRALRGHVDSIAAATGSRFSLLPPENATGNYVKVVQRIPVKILFEPGQDPERRLRPGMSVVPTVLTR